MRNLWLILLVLPVVISFFENGDRLTTYAKEDPIEDEGEAEVEEVGTVEEEEEESKTTASPDADTTLLFVKPIFSGSSQMEIPAGLPVEFLVGFRNKGEEDFIVESLEASFRYPMDFSFYIQNFSAIGYHKTVTPNHEATFHYSFIPSEAFAGRPFGLNINLMYRDASGNPFQEAVFNETVQIIELEEGLDGETFFLYVFLAAGVVLLLVIGQQTLLSVGKKRSPSSRKAAPVETGTNNPNNVDYDWLPRQTLASLSK
ncbi:unnamed protein product [Callosobruchus maculatus]|uniref:Translocon-associated protein subunit alpha n=1 Tax=Callosobruchus maculatus TaxID=64391 RepID=A0A653BG23_CALMS|nr:unnamed protein product [Callosobruchus maculatus]